MLKISEKGQQLPASPIRKLVPFAEAAKKRGIKVYHLNIGQPDIETPQCALDAIKNMSTKVIAYTHSAGIQSYRDKLVSYYKTVGIDVTSDNIMITTGGSEAITMAMTVCMNAGDEILIPEPFYANYTSFAMIAGAKVVPIPASIKNDFALPSIEEFEKRITPRTKAVMVCNPNNPTGYLYSREELEKLSVLVKKHNLYLFSDEVYREFCYDGVKHFSVMNLRDIDQHVVLMDSVSKRYSMCGVRVGALVTRNKDIFNSAMKIAQARLCPPYLGQIAGEAAIDTPQSYFDGVIKEYIARRNYMVEALNKMEGVYCPKPKGAFYAVVKLPVDNSDKFAQWLLEEFSYNGKTVMVAPASGFYSTPGSGSDEVRIAYVLKIEDLKAAMECLEAALKVYPGRTK